MLSVEILYSITVSQSKTMINKLTAVWTYFHSTFLCILIRHVHLRTTYVHPWLSTVKLIITFAVLDRISMSSISYHNNCNCKKLVDMS